MYRSELPFLLGLLQFCAAQDAAPSSNSTSRVSCAESSEDFCVRSCCPPGENFIHAERRCAIGAVDWRPSFLSAEASHKVIDAPITECGPNEDFRIFSPHDDSSVQFDVRRSGELTVSTSSGAFDLGDRYCFRNIEASGLLFETVRSCVPKVVPQVSGLVSIDDVSEVSFHKCCPVGQMLGLNNETQDFECINGSISWLPDVLHGDPTEVTQLTSEKARVKTGNINYLKYECPPDTVAHYIHPATTKFYLQADSWLLIATHNISIKPDHFCLDLTLSSSKPHAIGQVCYDDVETQAREEFEELCPEGVCVRKCCAPGFILSNSVCVPSTVRDWQPTFHDEKSIVSPPDNYTLLHGSSECDRPSFIFSTKLGQQDVPFLQANGDVILPSLSLNFRAHQCCMDLESYYDEGAEKTLTVETAFCCLPKDVEDMVRGYVTNTLLSISSICLFVMLAIYMLVPKLRNVHGKCLMSHAAALFVAFFLTVYNQVIGVNLGAACHAVGLMLYYFFIAALFWLNVMSFDIWWTFAHLRTQAPSQRSLRNRFIRHSVYAWGVPLLMTMLLAFLNYAPDDVIPQGAILRPELGERKCFLSGKEQELYYFYVPIFIVTGVNILFFAATAWTLYQAEKSSRILNRKRTARDRLKVYVNLFIIMEVSWIAECLSTQIGPIQAWYFTDIINASQGLLIFLLFIARSSTRQTIKERLAELTKRGSFHPRPPGKADGTASQPTKTTTTTTTTATNSSAARKASENETYQMTVMKTAPGSPRSRGNGSPPDTASGDDDVTTDELDPAPHDCAC